MFNRHASRSLRSHHLWGAGLAFVVGCASQAESSTELPTLASPTSLAESPSPTSLPRLPGRASLARRTPWFEASADGLSADVRGAGYTASVRAGSIRVRNGEDAVRASDPGALELLQESVRRGGQELAEGGDLRNSGRGLERHYSSGLVANVVARPEGLEETWRFNEKPLGNDDLVVRIPVRTLLTGASDLGELVFYDPTAQAGLRFGRTAWVSADGTRTPLVPTLTADTIELRVPASVLEASTYPALLDPLVSPSTASGTNYYAPSMATAHTGETLACYENYATPSTPKIQCRLWSGTPGSFTTVVPSSGTAAQYEPNVTYDRATSSFFVVWRDMRGAKAQTYMTNVRTTGALRIADTYLSAGISPDNAYDQYSPKIACLYKTATNQNHCNVVWGAITGNGYSEVWTSDFRFRSPGYSYVYWSSGSQEPGFSVKDVQLENYAPSTAADTTNFVTVWEKDVDGAGQTKIRGTVMAPGGCTIDFLPSVDTAGDLTGGLAFSETGNQMSPHVVWNGNVGVAYVSYVTDRAGNRDVRIRRVSYTANFGGCTMTSNAGGTGTDVSVSLSDQDAPMLACTSTALGASCAVTLTHGSAPMSVNARIFTTSNASPYLTFLAPMFAVGGTAAKRQTSSIGAAGSTFQVTYDERNASGVWKVGANSFDTAGTVSLPAGVMASP